MTRPQEDTLEPEAVPADERGGGRITQPHTLTDAMIADYLRRQAGRGRTNHITVTVDPRRTIAGQDLAALLRHAVLVLPADVPLVLPEGMTIASMVTASRERPHSMAAHEREAAPETRGLTRDPDMGREG